MASKLLTKLRGSEDWEVCNVIKKEGLAVGMVEVQREIDQGFYDDHKIYALEEFLEEGQKPRYE